MCKCIAALMLIGAACSAPDPSITGYAQGILADATTHVGKHYWVAHLPVEICAAPSYSSCSPVGTGFGFTVEEALLGAPQTLAFFVRIREDDGTTAYLGYEPGTAESAWASEDPAAVAARVKATQSAQLKTADANRKPTDDAEEAMLNWIGKYCHSGGPPPALGMTQKEIVRAWCLPTRVYKSTNKFGTTEQWVYSDKIPGNNGIVSFENGIVTAIQTSE
jgi:hypothetical protein